jgi:hypothetical protein
MGVKVRTLCAVDTLTTRHQELTRQFSRVEAEEHTLCDASDYELSEEIVRRDAKHMQELGSSEARTAHHNDAQKTTRKILDRINAVLSNDP